MYVIYLSGKCLLVTFLNTLININLFLKHLNHFQESIFYKWNIYLCCTGNNRRFLRKSSETNSVCFGEYGQIWEELVRLPVPKEFSPAQHFLQQGSPWSLHQNVNSYVSFSSPSMPCIASKATAFLFHFLLLVAIEWLECFLKIIVQGEREKPIIFSWWLATLD